MSTLAKYAIGLLCAINFLVGTESVNNPLQRLGRQTDAFYSLCPGRSISLTQDPTDCMFYYRCTRNIATRAKCPNWTYFNPLSKMCDNNRNVQGCTKPINAHISPDTFTCPERTGVFQDKTDCSLYYNCLHFVATRYQCPSGTLFNPETKLCEALYLAPSGCALMPRAGPAFECPPQDGVYEDPTICTFYYTCINSVATRYACPANTVFHTDTKQCGRSRLYECHIREGRDACGPSTIGLKQFRNDCSRFFQCLGVGPGTNHRCDGNKLFDPSTSKCQHLTTTPANCTLKTATTPGSSFICPVTDGQYQDETDCSFYFICVDSVPSRHPCPADTLFDPSLGRCTKSTRPPNGCTPNSAATRKPFTCPKLNGKYPDTSDCRHYYNCKNLMITRHQCPGGYLFDMNQQTCFRQLSRAPDGCTPLSCPVPNGTFTDDTDCGHYYTCTDSVPVRKQCPRPQLFNVDTGRCEEFNTAYELVDCTIPKWWIDIQRQKQNQPLICPTTGTRPYQKDCSFFYTCNNTILTRRQCGLNQLYNPNMGGCELMTIRPIGCVLPSWWISRMSTGSTHDSTRPGSQSGTITGTHTGTQGGTQGATMGGTQAGTQADTRGGSQADTRGGSQADTQGGTRGDTHADTRGGSQAHTQAGTHRFVCPVADGEFQRSEDCTTLWRCDNFEARRMNCPLNLVFNPTRGYCDWPRALPSITGCTMPTTRDNVVE